MKKQLLFLASLLSFQIGFTQMFDVQALKFSGADDKRINIVIMGDGYQVGELDQFETDATAFMDDLFSQEPYASYENYFNVYIIKVISIESGASHPGTAGDEPGPPDPIVPVSTVNNFFGTAYDSFGVHRLLYTSNTALISSVLADNFPMYDQALILVNAPYYGGSGGEFPVASTGFDAGEIAIHELGHSFVDLNDEYYPGDALAAESINMTQDNNPVTIKWKNWVGTNGVDIFPYALTGAASTWFRPHETCKMRYLGFSFCAVCTEGTIEKIHDLVPPIDSYVPSNTMINSPTFPLDFQLNLIQTIPNTLESTWTLNTSEFATNIEAITLQESDLINGANNLTAVVHDTSALLDIDGHETIHVYTVSWNIDYNLGIQDIEANNYSITMYPNPSNNIVNFSMENTLGKDILIAIVSMDGKKIKSENISNNENTQIDISALSQGIYIANFYANDVLISSKRLLKN
jgi:hypothetical protein